MSKNMISKNSVAPNFTFFNKRDLVALSNMLTPVLFLSIVGLHFHEFVWHAIAANLYINTGIILAASFGVYLILGRFTSAQTDFRIIERFGYEAAQGMHMDELLKASWLGGRYVRHYLTRIAKTGGTLATQLEHSAIESELHALQVDYESRLELPQFLVGFMIAMGLLGTFIGLLETLTGISGMLDNMGGDGADIQKQFMQLVSELRKPLAGMGIAFSASMFGLITSLMLAIMMTNLRRYLSRVISLARNIMHDLVEMSRERTGGTQANLSPDAIDALTLAAHNQSSLPAETNAELTEDQTFFIDSAPRGGSGLDPAMAGRFELMTKKMEALIDVITENTENTRRLNDLIGYGPRMKELSEKSLEELKKLSVRQFDTLHALEGLSSQNAESKDIAIGTGRHLSEIKENFTKMGKNTGILELIASTVGGHSALLEALLEESKRSQQGLAIINRSIVEAKR